MTVIFLKTHVDAYTKKDGTFVAAHEDKRVAVKPADSRSTANVTETPQFKRWFGNSKVVDAKGHPLVVYHGSGTDFDEFDPGRLGDNTGYGDAMVGFHFADNRADADHYASMAASKATGDDQASGVVRKFYLSLQNPLIIGMDESDGNAGDRTQEFLDDKNAAKAYAEENGHDGIIYLYGTNVDSGYTAIAFRPEQIKSANDNNGDFDPESGNIRKSLSPVALFFKGFIGPYLRGGKMVNLKGYHSKKTKKVTATDGQSSLFADLASPPEVKQTAKVARALTAWMDRHGGPAGMARLLADMSPEHQGKLVDAMAKIGKTDVATVRGMLQAPPAPATQSEPDLFSDPQRTEPTRELIEEHERLVDVLNSPSHEDDKAEAKKQAAELEEMKQEVGLDAISMTPKQYHDAKLRKMAADAEVDLSEVRQMYDTEAGRKENEGEWVSAVMASAKAGKELSRATLDKLHEVRPGAVGQIMHDYPDAKLPSGYQVPDARKVEKEERAARIAGRKEAKATVKQETAKKPTKAQQTRARRMAVLDVLGEGWKADAGVDGAKDKYTKVFPKADGGKLEVTIMPEKTVEGNFYVGSYHRGGKRTGSGSNDSSAKTIEEAKAIAERFAGIAAEAAKPDSRILFIKPSASADSKPASSNLSNNSPEATAKEKSMDKEACLRAAAAARKAAKDAIQRATIYASTLGGEHALTQGALKEASTANEAASRWEDVATWNHQSRSKAIRNKEFPVSMFGYA